MEEIDAEFELVPNPDDCEDDENSWDNDSDGSDGGLRLGEKRGADETTETECIEDDRITIGAGVFFLEIEFIEDEGEDGLHAEINDGVEDESMIDFDVHVHELDVGIDMSEDAAKNENSGEDPEDEAGHDGVFVAVADFADVGADTEN